MSIMTTIEVANDISKLCESKLLFDHNRKEISPKFQFFSLKIEAGAVYNICRTVTIHFVEGYHSNRFFVEKATLE